MAAAAVARHTGILMEDQGRNFFVTGGGCNVFSISSLNPGGAVNRKFPFWSKSLTARWYFMKALQSAHIASCSSTSTLFIKSISLSTKAPKSFLLSRHSIVALLLPYFALSHLRPHALPNMFTRPRQSVGTEMRKGKVRQKEGHNAV